MSILTSMKKTSGYYRRIFTFRYRHNYSYKFYILNINPIRRWAGGRIFQYLTPQKHGRNIYYLTNESK